MNNFHRSQNFWQFSNLLSHILLKKRHTSLFSGICREIRTNFHQNFAEKMQNSTQKMKEIGKSLFIRQKMLTLFGWNQDLSGAKVRKSCRSRQELSNEYLLAKIGVDTAENEPLKVWRKIQFIIHSPPYSSEVRRALCLAPSILLRCAPYEENVELS